MSKSDTLRFADIPLTHLSSGERQRVYFAMLLAQDTWPIFLHIKSQFEPMRMIEGFTSVGKVEGLIDYLFDEKT